MANAEKTLSQAIMGRRATPSFDGTPIPAADLLRIGSIEPWALWLDGRH